jgi:hypothetical protein
MLKSSTGLRNAVLATGSYKSALDGGFLNLYTGTIPADADAALGEGATLLCPVTLSNDGETGLTFDGTPINGRLAKTVSETWSGTIIHNATATFFRFVLAGDTGDVSTTAIRVQGTIGVSGYDMDMLDPNLEEDNIQQINYFYLALPA